MNNYSFETLNDEEFEEICKELLAEELGLDFRTYKKGKDDGIDLSCINENSKRIIGQVKHYPKSKFSNLKSSLKKELEKVKEKDFDRYILVTSLDLTVNQVEKIMELMNGIIKSEDDIYDLKKLNTILQKKGNEWIEKKYYKLWLSSTTVLNRIINNAQENNIEYYIDEIKNKIKLYVVTENFNKAFDILNKTNMLLIHGEPGVGKTVLAEMLVYRHLDKGYKLKFVTGNKIKELEEIMSSDKKEKEVIFIDDFLGSNFLEIFTQTSENKLVFFLKKYLKKEYKKVILTTRTTIYNKGIQQSEALDRLSIEFKKYNLEITSYNILDKAKILYNHLYFNLIPSEYKMKVKDHQEYLRIVEHQNYTPRLIEFITNINRILDINPYDYIKFIFDNLDNPKEIWKNEFENKISDEDRFLVCTLFTFKENVDEHILRNAFEERYNYEVENNNFIRIQNAFNKSLESLSKEFIKINREINNRYIKVSFVNPSINDFLINYLSTNIDEVKRVLNGIKYIDQLEKFKADNKICRYNSNMEKEVKKAIKNIIVNNFNNIEEYKIKKDIYVLEIILELYKDDNTMKPLIKNILYELIKDRRIKDKENLNILIDLVSNKNINLSDVEDLFRKKNIKEEIRGEEIIFNLIEYFESFAKYVKMIRLNFSYEEALAMLTTRYIYNNFDEICGQTITDFCCDITFYDECGFVDETGEACFDFNGAKSLLEDNFYKYAEDIFSEYEEEFSHFSIYKPVWEMIKSTFEIYYKEKILIGIEEIWNENYKKNYTSGKHNYNNAESSSNRKERIKYYDDIDRVRSMFNRM